MEKILSQLKIVIIKFIIKLTILVFYFYSIFSVAFGVCTQSNKI